MAVDVVCECRVERGVLQVMGEGACVRWGVCVSYVCVKCVYGFMCSFVYIRTYVCACAYACLLSLCVRCWLPSLQVSVSDYSGGTWLTLFQEQAEQVLGRRSEEMGQLKEEVRAAEGAAWGYRRM